MNNERATTTVTEVAGREAGEARSDQEEMAADLQRLQLPRSSLRMQILEQMRGRLALQRQVDQPLEIPRREALSQMDQILAHGGRMDTEQPPSRVIDRLDVVVPIHQDVSDGQCHQQGFGTLRG